MVECRIAMFNYAPWVSRVYFEPTDLWLMDRIPTSGAENQLPSFGLFRWNSSPLFRAYKRDLRCNSL